MIRVKALLILLAIASSACSLSSQATTPVPPTAFQLPPTSTQIQMVPSATAQLLPTQPIATAAPIPTKTACQPRADWYIYFVVSGDTLAKIALWTNSSVDQLAQANCLANANTIFVGQQLRVPKIPPTVTPVTPMPTTVGYVDILPFVNGASGIAELDFGASVTLRWNDAPLDASSVQFVLLNTATEGSQVIATDSNPSDGAAAGWVVPNPLSGQIAAYAYRADMSLMRSSFGRQVVGRPPLATMPQITSFRQNGNTIEWQTLNIGLVNIVWTGSDGAPGGSFVQQPANGSLILPTIGSQFAPYAYFYLFALDANGHEILDPQYPGNVLGMMIMVPVN